MDSRGIASSGGRLWVVNRSGKAIMSVSTDFNTITPHPVTAGPQEVAAGPGGQVAYTDPGQAPHEVGRLTQGAGALKSLGGADPFGITFAQSDGAYWFAEFAGPTVGRLTPSGQVTHPVGKFSAGSGPRHIAAGPNNTLWVALEQGKKVGRITGVTPPPAKPAGKPGGKPGDKAAPRDHAAVRRGAPGPLPAVGEGRLPRHDQAARQAGQDDPPPRQRRAQRGRLPPPEGRALPGHRDRQGRRGQPEPGARGPDQGQALGR